jgi:hypothetical protein
MVANSNICRVPFQLPPSLKGKRRRQESALPETWRGKGCRNEVINYSLPPTRSKEGTR